MNRLARHAFEATAATALMAGALTGCQSNPVVEVEGQIQMYGIGTDLQIVEDVGIPPVETVIEECPAPIKLRPLYNEQPDVDRECLERVQPGQRINKTVTHYIIYVSIANPARGEAGQPKYLEEAITINEKEWARLDPKRHVTIQAKGDQILDAVL